jgi:hypothetical protein
MNGNATWDANDASLGRDPLEWEPGCELHGVVYAVFCGFLVLSGLLHGLLFDLLFGLVFGLVFWLLSGLVSDLLSLVLSLVLSGLLYRLLSVVYLTLWDWDSNDTSLGGNGESDIPSTVLNAT